MKKLKIRGITGTPLFLTRFHGFIDGKRGVIVFNEGKWHGHYLRKKEAIYHAFLRHQFLDIEERTADLYRESATLSVEYEDVERQLNEPETSPSGNSQSARDRSAARIAGVKPALQARKLAIKLRMAVIEENMIQLRNNAAGVRLEAASLTERRVHAYLHGATLSKRAVHLLVEYTVDVAFDMEAEHEKRHRQNDELRRTILAG